MVSRISPSPTPKGTGSSGDTDAMAEIRAAMEELQCHNQTLEDDVQSIIQRHYKVNPLE